MAKSAKLTLVKLGYDICAKLTIRVIKEKKDKKQVGIKSIKFKTKLSYVQYTECPADGEDTGNESQLF